MAYRLKYEQILVSLPKIGTILEYRDKTYNILSTATYQEESGKFTTKATCLEIDPQTGADLGKDTEIITIESIPVFM